MMYTSIVTNSGPIHVYTLAVPKGGLEQVTTPYIDCARVHDVIYYKVVSIDFKFCSAWLGRISTYQGYSM